MKMIHESNVIEHETGLIIQFQDNDIDRISFSRMTFRLDIFCSMPILIFGFQTQSQPLIFPIRFVSESAILYSVPVNITLQIQGQDSHLRYERMFDLSPIQSEEMKICIREQADLTPGQLDVIEDYIYSDYIGMLMES
ncbi:hypothetical protein DSL64_21465 [Dyadobacter luteus]|uniref:Uncharacterized protein n=1 Tax=Dyadobacter luteus TaxID=2259619 RepID=A0A3D8Y6H2_9BACT|nr:hypothetical protein [Dyadobacter luteus]REA58179.1 hypothetical protein DSL64_21465 [Dyadobacter luteus]